MIFFYFIFFTGSWRGGSCCVYTCCKEKMIKLHFFSPNTAVRVVRINTYQKKKKKDRFFREREQDAASWHCDAMRTTLHEPVFDACVRKRKKKHFQALHDIWQGNVASLGTRVHVWSGTFLFKWNSMLCHDIATLWLCYIYIAIQQTRLVVKACKLYETMLHSTKCGSIF